MYEMKPYGVSTVGQLDPDYHANICSSPDEQLPHRQDRTGALRQQQRDVLCAMRWGTQTPHPNVKRTSHHIGLGGRLQSTSAAPTPSSQLTGTLYPTGLPNLRARLQDVGPQNLRKGCRKRRSLFTPRPEHGRAAIHTPAPRRGPPHARPMHPKQLPPPRPSWQPSSRPGPESGPRDARPGAWPSARARPCS